MADSDLDFQLWLKSRFDGDPLKAAQAEFAKTQQAAKKTDDSLREMGYSAEALKKQLLSLVAFAEVVAQFKEGFEQVAALEQAMHQLERAAKRNGDSFEDVKGKIVGMANALKRAAGVDDDAAIKAMSELYNATGDVANAMNLVALATDVAIGAGMDFQQANDLVTKAVMGQTRGLKELRISIEETGDKTENANKALEAIRKNFGGAANDAKGLKVEINRLSEAWEDMRNNAIESATPALSAWLKFAKTWVAVIAGAADMIGEILLRVGTSIMKVGDAVGFLMSGNITQAKASMKAAGKEMDGMFDNLVLSAKIASDKIEGIWSGAGPGGGINAGPAKGIVAGGGGSEGTGTDKHNPMLGPSLKEFEDYKEKVFAFEQKLIKERAAMWAKANAARKKLEDFTADEDKKRMREIDAERERLMDAQTQRILDEVRLKKQTAEYEKQLTLDTMSMVSGALSTMFGESKEVAVAEAIINTYVGASKALAQTGIWGVVQAAIIIAAGMAQVAKIQSTEPSTKGSGFDDPSNDAAARIGGRRWAADMIGEFTRGVSAGWRDGMSGGGSTSNTYDNRRTFNVHMHGAGLIDPTNVQMMKQFKRTLDVIDTQIEGQRTIARNR